MKCVELFRDGDHRWLAFGNDPDKPDAVIDTTQYAVISGGQAMLLDPGGSEIFPAMVSALSGHVAIDTIRHLFISHQDPDTGSSIGLWRRVCEKGLTVHASWMWQGFLAHYDREAVYDAIPDEGNVITLAGRALTVLPAHYLHSPGNFSLYDPAAKMLFSGDIGAGLVPSDRRKSLYVQDFSSHIQFIEGFHKRWMGSARARDAWIEMASRLDVNMLCPQHGLIYQGEDVKRFLEWFSRVEVGSGLASFSKARTGR